MVNSADLFPVPATYIMNYMSVVSILSPIILARKLISIFLFLFVLMQHNLQSNEKHKHNMFLFNTLLKKYLI